MAVNMLLGASSVQYFSIQVGRFLLQGAAGGQEHPAVYFSHIVQNKIKIKIYILVALLKMLIYGARHKSYMIGFHILTQWKNFNLCKCFAF